MNHFLNMVRGDTLSFGVEFEGLDQDLDSAYFTVRKSYDDKTPVFEKALGNGIQKLYENQYGVRIAPSDTQNISVGKYYYDLEIGVNSDVFTVLSGVLDIEPDVTVGKHPDATDFSITLILVGSDVSVDGETLIINV